MMQPADDGLLLRERRRPGASLTAQPRTAFANRAVWLAHLDQLGFTALDVTPEPANRWAGHRFATRSGAGRHRRSSVA
jgi:hypothetical protein